MLPEITRFIKSVDPDVVGLIEIDTGSIRSRKVNQAEKIAADLGMNTSYETKYGEKSFNQMLPIVRKQGNAFMAAPRVHGEKFHYFDTGIKRLIIELEMDDFAIFLVHLSLKYRHRHLQLRRLYDLIQETSKPVVVGLTARRMLLWSHSQMSGKPKELIAEIPLERVASFSVEKKKATFDTTITFTDGSGILLEAPKIANKPERFAASFSRLTGR